MCILLSKMSRLFDYLFASFTTLVIVLIISFDAHSYSILNILLIRFYSSIIIVWLVGLFLRYAQVVDYVGKDGRARKGLTTNFLKDREVGDQLPVFVAKTKFRLPEDPKDPVILLSTGAGISPYLGFLEQRVRIFHSTPLSPFHQWRERPEKNGLAGSSSFRYCG